VTNSTPRSSIPCRASLEVVDPKKQTDSTRVLATYGIDLLLAVRLSKE
jgi:hypothetical protein